MRISLYAIRIYIPGEMNSERVSISDFKSPRRLRPGKREREGRSIFEIYISSITLSLRPG